MDRAARLIRTAGIHYRLLPGGGSGQFKSLEAGTIVLGDVVRLDLDFDGNVKWKVGQHFSLTFPEGKGGIWQSHPFTPLSPPGRRQSYIFRARRGETSRISQTNNPKTKVILTGPYGNDTLEDYRGENVLCIAGGTGITFVLPVLLVLARSRGFRKENMIELVWVVRHSRDIEWVREEIEELRQAGLGVEIYSTRDEAATNTLLSTQTSNTESDLEKDIASSTPDLGSVKELSNHVRPDMSEVVSAFVRGSEAATKVYVSGPTGMMRDVKQAVAGCNAPGKVWKGDSSGLVELIYDERLE